MLPKLAHVKWFSENNPASAIESLSASEWGIILGVIIAGIILMFLVDKLFRPLDKKLDSNFATLHGWVPTVVRFSTALLLIFNFWKGYLFAPNIIVGNETIFLLMNAVLVAIALLLLFGVFTRLAGLLLLVIFLLGALAALEPFQLTDHLEYIGIGLFLLFSTPGKLSVNTKLRDPLSSLAKHRRLASPFLRTFVGLGLITLAFSEKLLNMTLSNDFLQSNSWNILSSFGVSDRNFIIVVGVIELLLGLTLVLNKAPRLGTLAILCAMIATAVVLGLEEVFGHLFAVGVVAAVWIGPNEGLFRATKKQAS